MTPDERWLAAVWQFVSAQVPPAPARVLEIGCGPLGGFVPMLITNGYEATGVDPEAPPGANFRQAEFGADSIAEPVDAIVACTSLHHVADLTGTLDVMQDALVPGGAVIVVEWARERFDEGTARWCFSRLPESSDQRSWLNELVAEWQESGQQWKPFCRAWAEAERMHAGEEILSGLADRFDGDHSFGPYFFSDLADTSEADEQGAIVKTCGSRSFKRLPAQPPGHPRRVVRQACRW